jgi:hypothetical protein
VGGDSSRVRGQLGNGVTQIYSNQNAFAALKQDGSVVTWGSQEYGGDSTQVSSRLTGGVVRIYSTAGAFAALKQDGSVVTWGSQEYGGDSVQVSSRLTGIVKIFSNGVAFAALKNNGSVVTWGRKDYGGNSSGVVGQLQDGVVEVYGTGGAFAALKQDGSVVTWGDGSFGGNSIAVATQLRGGVTQLYGTGGAFAALKRDGSVVTWGDGSFGGNSIAVATQLQKVQQIVSNLSAFAAIRQDGSVVTWGDMGGDSSGVRTQLGNGVRQVYATGYGFAALKQDGSVVTWGDGRYGGDSSTVRDGLSGVLRIVGNDYAFAALKQDGSVVTWGSQEYGGDSSTVKNQLGGGVVRIVTTATAFAALKQDGSVVTWGDGRYGGDSRTVKNQLGGGVVSFADPFQDDRWSSATVSPVPTANQSIQWTTNSGTPSLAIVATNGIQNEGNGGTATPFSFAITRSGDTSGITAVNWAVTGSGTNPANGGDFVGNGLPNGMVTFAAGEITKVITVNVQGDGIPEADESFTVTLTNPTNGASLTATAATGVIKNDDIQTLSTSTVTLSLTSPSTVTEDGPQNLFYVFRRTGDVTNPLTVNFTVGGTATVGSDYVQRGATTFGATTGSVTFRAGSEVVILPIDPSSDTVSDGNETVALTLTPVTGYTLGTTGAVSGTILDNDVAPGTVVRASIPNASDITTRYEASNYSAFAALKSDGSVVTWGTNWGGGDSSSVTRQLTSGVTQIFSTYYSFAALKSDGSVVTWGSSDGGGNSSSVSSGLTSGVTQIFSTWAAFAALKSDDSVVTWGDSSVGGDSSSVSSSLTSGVTQIFSNGLAFAALKSDGSVVTWGNPDRGGNSSSVSSSLTSGVTQIFSTGGAFAALKSDGSVVTWGNSSMGGNSSSVTRQLTSGVTQIFSTYYSFAALKSDGSVVTWGNSSYGGDSSSVSSGLTSGVTQIFSTYEAFAALKSDGSVVTWGNSIFGGDSSSVSSRLTSGVTQIFSNRVAFAALKSDGSVVTWVNSDTGGDSSSVSSRLTSGVTQIFSTYYSFAALKSDGSVVTWGHSDYGGNSSSVSSSLTSGVTQIFSTGSAFAALKSDGSVVTWGTSNGADSSSVSSSLTSGVVSFADPFRDDRLVPGASTTQPSITLAVSPTSVTEDESTNLVYTFNRSGSDNDALTVNYTIGGTASLDDYGGATPGSGKTITFAEGSSTATLTIDPTADTTPEPNETVIVTLVAGTGYGIGTTTPVTGTITNDDITLAIAATTAKQLEGNSGTKPFTFTITRAGTAGTTAVNWAVTGSGTNTVNAADFISSSTLPSGTVTFAVGETSKTITVTVQGDTIPELDETFTVTLSGATNGAVITTASATGTITNDDIPGITLDVSPVSVTEDGVPNLVYTFTRPGITTNPLTVNYAIGGTASGNDYGGATPGSGKTITFAPGSSTAILTIDPTADTTPEPNETVIVTLVAGTGYGIGTTTPVTGTIINDDITLAIAATTAKQLEGNSGTKPFTFTITRAGTAGTTAVNWAVTGSGTNTVNAADFISSSTLPSGTVTFAVGETSKTITVTVQGDTIPELDETFTVTLSGATNGAVITTASATGTITNDDIPGITLDVSPVSVTEDGVPNLVYTFTRPGITTNPLTVNYAIGGTASGTDYGGATPGSGKTITFAPGSSTAILTIDPTADTTPEPNETVIITLVAGTGYGIGTTTPVTGTIINDDITLAIAATTANQTEGSSGAKPFTFTITRAGTAGTTAVNWAVTGSGTNPANAADFGGTLPSGTVTFAVGETSKTITVTVQGDTIPELDETFTVTLSGATNGAVITTATATGTITNDDIPGITLDVSPVSVTEDGVPNLVYTFTRPGITTNPLTVNYTIGGTASGTDYGGATPGSGKTITFAPGSSTATLTIDPTADTTPEPNETVIVTLVAGTGYGIGTTTPVTGTITNDDIPSITLAVSPVSVTEDGAPNLVYTFTRPGITTNPLTVNYAIGGTASGNDYGGATPGSGKTITFALGSSTAILTIDPTADTTPELDETVTVSLVAGTGYSIGTATPVTGTITNDDITGAIISATNGDQPEGNSGTKSFTFTIIRGNGSSDAAVRWAVTGGTTNPANATDFGGTLPSGTVNFAVGETSKTITVTVQGDTTREPDETFIITLFYLSD